MLAGLLIVQALAVGLAGEAPCTDTPPSAWSVEPTPLLVARYDACVDAVVSPEGAVVVAAMSYGNADVAVLEGATWTTEVHVEDAGCPVLDVSDGLVRAAIPGPYGLWVSTRTSEGWTSILVPPVDGLFAILPDGQLRTVEPGPLGETLVVHDTGTTADDLVPIPLTPPGGNLITLRALALGSGGSTHVLYQRNHRSALEYATNASGAWVFEIAEPLEVDQPNVFGWTSLGPFRPAFAVDAADRAHVAFRLKPSLKLAYATNRSGTWERAIVDHGAPIGIDVRMRLAVDGAPWLAYLRIATGDLALATPVGGTWATTTVDALDTAGTNRALALGPDGRWHLAYTRFDWRTWANYPTWPIQHAASVPCEATLPAPTTTGRSR
jgi:hypothetical protein